MGRRSEDACVVALAARRLPASASATTQWTVARCRCFAGAGAAAERKARASQGPEPVRGQKGSGQYETDLHANHHNNVALVDTHCCRRVVKPYPGEIRIHVTG